MRIEKLVVWHMRLEFFSGVCVWFCVHVNVPMCESKILCRGKSFHFSSTRLFVTTQATAFSVQPRPLAVLVPDPQDHSYSGQVVRLIQKTYSSSLSAQRAITAEYGLKSSYWLIRSSDMCSWSQVSVIAIKNGIQIVCRFSWWSMKFPWFECIGLVWFFRVLPIFG